MNRQLDNTIPAKPITIIQLNYNKKDYTILSLLNQYLHNTDILLLAGVVQVQMLKTQI